MASEEECLESLWAAAEQLGKSPTKAEYEALGLRPASATIMRALGGWNAAKEAADLRTWSQGELGHGEILPKPDWVEIPDDTDWESLNPQQRWYYKNRHWRNEVKERRRRALKRWLWEYKRDHCSCVRCGEDAAPSLDFHHENEKEAMISRMVNNGYSKESIKAEIDRCTVLCANCHRKEHYVSPLDTELRG